MELLFSLFQGCTPLLGKAQVLPGHARADLQDAPGVEPSPEKLISTSDQVLSPQIPRAGSETVGSCCRHSQLLTHWHL